MPVSSLSSAILSHMIAIKNVSVPLPRSVPGLKMPKHIDYDQLNALCLLSGQQGSSVSVLSAHGDFMKLYPKVFLPRRPRLPRRPPQDASRKPLEAAEESRSQQPDKAHNVAIYVKQARGGRSYGPRKFEEKLEEFLAILKKLPIHRTLREHNTVWKMLKTVPDLTSQLTDDNLRALSKNVISETWIKDSTVVGNDGFYVILKGWARPRTQMYKSLIEEDGPRTTFIPQSFHSYVCNEDLERVALTELELPPCGILLGPWSTFGTLEVTAQVQADPQVYSVVTEEDCEILKIPAINYAKLKSEKAKFENKQIVKLIRKCPYYEEWPTLSICELVLLVKWKKFPPGHVIVESGNIIPFVAYIHSGHCNVYRNIVGFMKISPKKVKKIRKLVYMGQLQKQESFGEISALLQAPFTCTVIAGEEVVLAVIEDKDLRGKSGCPSKERRVCSLRRHRGPDVTLWALPDVVELL
ncbi:PREDICTED: cyclic nucleotide-binding domain-containing protein 1 [Miniopterus natalensis]|uniref:cyclic nucleotide-binding domain-containing protein 1 n=1 Tax=Miniopterus natalensis TaxID=291302 RepID=UPI0007A71FBD|nr:PREDICTED: cyclic nucleotide-binding domain-containing protein 1 [Miniopterus natalensis]